MTFVVRPVSSADRALLREGFEHLDRGLRYRQFLTSALALVEFDPGCMEEHSGVLVAIDQASGEAVGLGRALPDQGDPVREPIRLTVAEHWRGRGVEDALRGALQDRAALDHLRRFAPGPANGSLNALDHLRRFAPGPANGSPNGWTRSGS